MSRESDNSSKDIPLAPIPVPIRVRFRQFRSSIMPGLVFVISLGALAILWRDHASIRPGAFEGRIVSSSAEIRSSSSGVLSVLRVKPGDQVFKGDLLATVSTVAPDYAEASLAVLRAELDLLKADFGDKISGSVYRFNRLKLDVMENKATIQAKKVDLSNAINNYQRDLQLNKDLVVSDQALENSRTAMDSLKAEVDALETTILTLENDLASGPDSFFENNPDGTKPELPSEFAASMQVAESRIQLLEAELQPVEIRSPIDGLVSDLTCRTGDNVFAGDSLMFVRSLVPEAIVGFIPEPVENMPQQGDMLMVRARNTTSHQSQVISVGPHIREIPIEHRNSMRMESEAFGLPIRLAVPLEIQNFITPGEKVLLSW